MDPELLARVESARASAARLIAGTTANGHSPERGAGDSVPVPPLGREGSEPNRFPFATASEFAVRTGGDAERMAPYLFSGGISDLAGPVKRAGKTTFALALVTALLSGAAFLGMRRVCVAALERVMDLVGLGDGNEHPNPQALPDRCQ